MANDTRLGRLLAQLGEINEELGRIYTVEDTINSTRAEGLVKEEIADGLSHLEIAMMQLDIAINNVAIAGEKGVTG